MSNRYAQFAPVVLRLALGIVFLLHGWPKVAAPGGVIGYFGRIGIPAPHVMAPLVGLVESIGGVLLIFGLGTRITAAVLAVDMLVAILTAKRGAGFVGGWEYEFVLFAAALSLALAGPVGAGASSQKKQV